jgi:DNA-binding FadR family transcriptional regulator
MGIISISHGERARVVQPNFRRLLDALSLTTHNILWNSERSLDELKQARLLFEQQMVKLAADLARPDDVASLRSILAEQEAAQADPPRFIRCDMHFHRQIASITRNSIFPSLSEAMMGWLGEFYVDLVHAPGAERLTIAEHGRIVDAIASNDPVAAERAMTDHVSRANELYRKWSAPGVSGT